LIKFSFTAGGEFHPAPRTRKPRDLLGPYDAVKKRRESSQRRRNAIEGFDVEQRAASNCSCIAGIPFIHGQKKLQYEAKSVSDWGAYIQYVTQSETDFNEVM
jgi:hypothetical protein